MGGGGGGGGGEFDPVTNGKLDLEKISKNDRKCLHINRLVFLFCVRIEFYYILHFIIFAMEGNLCEKNPFRRIRSLSIWAGTLKK